MDKTKDFRVINIMAKCNLHCIYCKNQPFEVDEDKIIVNISKIFKKFNKNTTCFRVECRGEITLYNKIIDYLEECCRDGYVIEILTNGLLLDKVLCPGTKLKAVVSLDGHTERMNRFRRLKQDQVNRILDNIFTYKAEIQCVYCYQNKDEMNSFISYLKERNFDSYLHIFPCSLDGKITELSFVYDELIKADFLPPKEFFDRWDYIVKHNKRNFICDMIKNGYMYYINNEKLGMVKCDGIKSAVEMIEPFGEEREHWDYPCGNCINHSEYNNTRELLKINKE
ncbi:MAG TPA: hypothetical protein DC000_07495 [Clostridiales bacterium]|nr:hypothetical protein [Clostridiales bacterium]